MVALALRRQCGAAPASCARLQPRQFPAHAGDAGADQGMVADDLEGQADQDRREGGEPRPLHHLPDGRGRHRTANVPRDFAAHRGTAAAATTSASVRRSMSCIQEQPTEGVRPNARENGQIRPFEQAFGLSEVLVAVSTSRLSCKRAGKARTLMPVLDSSGESRLKWSGFLQWNISAEEGRFLQELIRAKRPSKSIEIGCAYGISSLFICEALREVGAKSHTIIDPYQLTTVTEYSSGDGYEGI